MLSELACHYSPLALQQIVQEEWNRKTGSNLMIMKACKETIRKIYKMDFGDL